MGAIRLHASFLAGKNILPDPISRYRGINIGGNHGVKDVKNVDRFCVIFDLESTAHVLLDVFLDCPLLVFIPIICLSPLGKILCDLLLHIVHVQARGADGHSGEREVCDGFSCLLQCSHHLAMGIVNMAEEGMLIVYTEQWTVQELLNVDLYFKNYKLHSLCD